MAANPTPIHEVPTVVVQETTGPELSPIELVGIQTADLYSAIFNRLPPALAQARAGAAMDLARIILAGPLAQLLLPKE